MSFILVFTLLFSSFAFAIPDYDVVMHPTYPYRDDSLFCQIITQPHDDGNVTAHKYRFEIYSDISSAWVPLTQYSFNRSYNCASQGCFVGEKYRCSVLRDSYFEQDVVISDSVTIQNHPPQIDSVDIVVSNPVGSDTTPYTSSNLECIPTVSDAEADPTSLTFNWRVISTADFDVREISRVLRTTEPVYSQRGVATSTLDSSYTTSGDTVLCVVSVDDQYDAGEKKITGAIINEPSNAIYSWFVDFGTFVVNEVQVAGQQNLDDYKSFDTQEIDVQIQTDCVNGECGAVRAQITSAGEFEPHTTIDSSTEYTELLSKFSAAYDLSVSDSSCLFSMTADESCTQTWFATYDDGMYDVQVQVCTDSIAYEPYVVCNTNVSYSSYVDDMNLDAVLAGMGYTCDDVDSLSLSVADARANYAQFLPVDFVLTADMSDGSSQDFSEYGFFFPQTDGAFGRYDFTNNYRLVPLQVGTQTIIGRFCSQETQIDVDVVASNVYYRDCHEVTPRDWARSQFVKFGMNPNERILAYFGNTTEAVVDVQQEEFIACLIENDAGDCVYSGDVGGIQPDLPENAVPFSVFQKRLLLKYGFSTESDLIAFFGEAISSADVSEFENKFWTLVDGQDRKGLEIFMSEFFRKLSQSDTSANFGDANKLDQLLSLRNYESFGEYKEFLHFLYTATGGRGNFEAFFLSFEVDSFSDRTYKNIFYNPGDDNQGYIVLIKKALDSISVEGEVIISDALAGSEVPGDAFDEVTLFDLVRLVLPNILEFETADDFFEIVAGYAGFSSADELDGAVLRLPPSEIVRFNTIQERVSREDVPLKDKVLAHREYVVFVKHNLAVKKDVFRFEDLDLEEKICEPIDGADDFTSCFTPDDSDFFNKPYEETILAAAPRDFTTRYPDKYAFAQRDFDPYFVENTDKLTPDDVPPGVVLPEPSAQLKKLLATLMTREGLMFSLEDDLTVIDSKYYTCNPTEADFCFAPDDQDYCSFHGNCYADGQMVEAVNITSDWVVPITEGYGLQCQTASPGVWGLPGLPVPNECNNTNFVVCAEDNSDYNQSMWYDDQNVTNMYCAQPFNGSDWDWYPSPNGIDGFEDEPAYNETCYAPEGIRSLSVDNNCNAHKVMNRDIIGNVTYSSYNWTNASGDTIVYDVFEDVDAFDVYCFQNTTGTVVDTDGDSIANATVRIFILSPTGEDQFFASTTTNGSGHFNFTYIPATQYRFIVSKSLYNPAIVDVSTEYRTTNNYTITLSAGECRSDCTRASRPGVCDASCNGVNGCGFYDETYATLLDGKPANTNIYMESTGESIQTCEGDPVSVTVDSGIDVGISTQDISCADGRNLIIIEKIALKDGEPVKIKIPICQ